MATNWFIEEMARGLTQLAALNLRGRPASDMLEGVVVTWARALWAGRSWDAMRDTPRIREGFARLAGDCTEFPAPRQLLDAIPAATPPKMLTKPKPNPAVAQAAIAECLALLREGEAKGMGVQRMDGAPLDPFGGA